jgi:NitT/TauT family transport system ATP-binding protein
MISFEKVGISFGKEQVLAGIDFTVKKGEFLCIVGPSGCGKSLTLRAMGGLIRIDNGTVLLDGVPADHAWKKLTYIFQSPRLLPWRTALGNVIFAMEARNERLSKKEMTDRAVKYLSLVGLEKDIHKYPGVLSGGERQRVSLARALSVDPQVILMDEPFAALDINTRERMCRQIIEVWQKTAGTIVFVTHDLNESLFLADRIIIFSSKPTKILKTIDLTDVSRPRDFEGDQRILEIRDEVRSLFKEVLGVEDLQGDAAATTGI